MSDPRFPLSSGYRPPKIFDYQLKLDPEIVAMAQAYGFIGWHAQPRMSTGLVALGPTYPDLDAALQPYLASLSLMAATQPNQPMSALVPKSMAGASADSGLMDAIRDAVSDAAQDKFWKKIPGRGTNYLTGEPATIGSIDPSGGLHYDGLDAIVPGSQLKSSWLLPPWSLGKRFPFASGNDVLFKLYIDKDALDKDKPAGIISGGSITISGKSSDGLPRSLVIVGGRDQTGGPAGAILFEATWK